MTDHSEMRRATQTSDAIADQHKGSKQTREFELKGPMPATRNRDSYRTTLKACTVRILFYATQVHGVQRQNGTQLQWFTPLTQNHG